MKSNYHTNEEMAELYLKLYTDCIKYKKEKINNSKNEISCYEYQKSFEKFTNKCIINKET